MALSNNLINLTPDYMYQHNGRCHFYHYSPLMGGVLSPSSVPMPRKLPPGGTHSSETSSGEEGINSTTPVSNTKLLLLQDTAAPPYSSLSSSQSSPYASPPQSPKSGIVTTSAPSLTFPQSLVTGTTTTIVVSRSSPRPSVKNSSHPSSPGPVSVPYSSQVISRCKPPVVTKGQQRHVVGERPNNSRNHSSPNHCLVENTNTSTTTTGSCGSPLANGSTPTPPPSLSKENGTIPNSFSSCNKEVSLNAGTSATSPNRTYLKSNGRTQESSTIIKLSGSGCTTGNVSSSSFLNHCADPNILTLKTMVSNVTPETTVVSSNPSFKGTCSVLPSTSTMVASTVTGNQQQRGFLNGPELPNSIRTNNMRNLKEENHLKDTSAEVCPLVICV